MIKVSDSYALYELLSKKYGKRLQVEPLSALGGAVQGKFDGSLFNLTFKSGEYLLLTVGPNGRHVIDELTTVLKSVMNDCEPIIKYDMNYAGKGQDMIKPTIEWDIQDPEGRIKEIINGRAFPDKPEITNIELFNGKSIEDYVETKEEQEERIKNARIYGIDTGSIQDVETINNLGEVDLFFQIYSLGHHIWRCNHDMAHGRIPQIDLTEEQYALEYMVYLTTKFGVELAEPEIDQHIRATESYNAWYQFYSNHFNYTLTNDEWKEFMTLKEAGEDVSAYMPKGDWRDLLPKGPKKELK